MKKTFRYIFGVLAMAFLAVSCVEEVHEAGEPDVEGCYGVYFPAQDTSLTLDPDSDARTATIIVARTNTEGTIDVPVEVTDTSGLFMVYDLYFEDGQTESSFVVTFDDIELGVSYLCSFQITDPQYASYYGSNPVALDLTVILERWDYLGTGSWVIGSDDLFSADQPIDVEIYQNAQSTNQYRVAASGIYGYGDEYFTFQVMSSGNTMNNGVTLTQDGLVYFESFNTGYYHSTYGEYVYMIHPGDFTGMTEDDLVNNAVSSYKEDGSVGVVSIAPCYYLFGVGGGWWYYDSTDAIKIVLPGAQLVDYSISISTGVATNGVLPVLFTCGSDVASVRYQVFEGTLSSAAVSDYITAIGDGSQASVEGPVGTTFGITMDETGVYTIVAVTFDESGEYQEGASAAVTYLAAGDEMPVVVSTGIYATGKYGSSGYSSDNTLEYYIYGSELTSVKYLLVASSDYQSSPAVVQQTLLAQSDVDADVLAEINGTGYVGVYTDCVPGTDYTFLVYASNGYEYTVVTAEASTTGVLDVALEEMFGTYSVEVSSYFYGTDYSPETWALAESDDASQGNIMMTVMMDMTLPAPVYGYFDDSEYTLTFYDWQYVGEISGVDTYFANYYGTDVVFDVIGSGRFSASGTMFGLYILSEGTWFDVYLSVSGTRTSASSSAASVSPKSLKPQQVPAGISQPDKSRGTLLTQFCGPRAVQTASFNAVDAKGLTVSGRQGDLSRIQSYATPIEK